MSSNADSTVNSTGRDLEWIRKSMIQCQYCGKSQASGIKLRRCAGCKISLYCSKECQTNGWPGHKETCKINRKAFECNQTLVDMGKTLRAFTAKHRPLLSEAGVRALDLCVDPSRSLRDVLFILLRSNPRSKRAETAFSVSGAMVLSIDDLGAAAEQTRQQLRQVTEDNKRIGMLGAMFVLLSCEEEAVFNAVPIGFSTRSMQNMHAGMPWKELLIDVVNGGRIL